MQPLIDSGALVQWPTVLPCMWRHFSLLQRTGRQPSLALAAFVLTCREAG